MENIFIVDNQYPEVKSGPGRFCEYLRLNVRTCSFVLFDISSNKNDIILKRSRIWLINSLKIALCVWSKKNDIFIFQSALEAIFVLNPIVVFVSDDNYLKPRPIFFYNVLKKQFYKNFSRYVYSYLEKWVVKRSKLVVANSNYMVELIKHRYRVPPKRIHLLYKGVDINFFKPKNYRNFSCVTEFCFVKNDWRRGGLEQAYNFVYNYSKSIKSLCTLRICGVSELDILEIKKTYLSKELFLNIEVYGKLKKEDLKFKIYDKSQCYLNFAIAEALGVAIMEASSCGLIPIVSGVGGMGEVLGKSYRFNLKKTNEKKIYRLLQDESLLNFTSNKLIKRMHKCFSTEILITNYNKLLKRLEIDINN